jgi:proline racemase
MLVVIELSTLLTVVDLHTEGEPFRIVMSGFPTIHGRNMQEKNAVVERDFGCLRRMILYEPRGRSTMCEAFLVEPTVPEVSRCKKAPNAIVNLETEPIIVVGTLLAERLYGKIIRLFTGPK